MSRSRNSPLKGALWSLVLLSSFTPVRAQTTPDFQPGFMYVIRIGPTSMDLNYLTGTIRPDVEEHMRQAYGLLDHMLPGLHVVMREEDQQWFVAYFDPERQTEAQLIADLNLLSWGFQRHDVQICPILKLHNASLRSDLTRAGGSKDVR